MYTVRTSAVWTKPIGICHDQQFMDVNQPVVWTPHKRNAFLVDYRKRMETGEDRANSLFGNVYTCVLLDTCFAWQQCSISILVVCHSQLHFSLILFLLSSLRWRFIMRVIIPPIIRTWVVLVFGFHWIPVKGKQAGVKEAPICLIAPHSNIMDSWMLTLYAWGSVMSRRENESMPIIGCEYIIWCWLRVVVEMTQ